jgi:hypothetical protein
MKRDFGSALRRLLRGGHRLNAAEFRVLETLVQALPPHLGPIVDAQFDAYDLVQREVDGRALNFYRTGRSSPAPPMLPGPAVDAPLLKARFASPDGKPLHAVLAASGGRAFCITFDRPLPNAWRPGDLVAEDVRPSWRSPFPPPPGQAS